MKFEVSSSLNYSVRSDSTLILNIHALRTPAQTVLSESFQIEPYVKAEELLSFNHENRFIRLEVPAKTELSIRYNATVDNACKIADYAEVIETPIGQLDADILPYLYPSRYCQNDKLYRLANNFFGYYKTPIEKVIAITNWINLNVEYLSGSTNAQTSAYDTVTEQAGVCRDFAHLGIALCRALSIPARYFTGYAYQLNPPDFHACFEAYLGNDWVLFDGTKLAPLNGLVKIANGRDAADTAIASIFGDVIFTGMSVNSVLADDGFEPYLYPFKTTEGISYL
jgi:transglutaminase-like putative cysteine protease